MTPIFCTAYIPPIDYMATLLCYETVLMEVKETFPKQTIRNRTRIMTAGGVRTLTVPVIRRNTSKTEDILIDNTTRWNIIHQRTIDAAYNASPFYEYLRDGLSRILSTTHTYLIDLNIEILEWSLHVLKTQRTISHTEDWQKETQEYDDFRNIFSDKKPSIITNQQPYYQVFSDRQPFTPNLGIIDLLMNLGPEAKNYLTNVFVPRETTATTT